MVLTDLSGWENRNRIRLENCHRYTGESAISYTDPPSESNPPAAPLEELLLPADFSAEVSLITPIDSETAAVGDEVQVRLAKDVRDRRRLIAPKGALLFGRIVQLHRLEQRFHLAIAVHSLEFRGAHADLAARQNVVSLYGAGPPPPGEPHPIVIESEHLKLPAGFLLHLRSRLVKSEKR